jgi:dTDP-4-dehydrorhamnose 3,5-epimerase
MEVVLDVSPDGRGNISVDGGGAPAAFAGQAPSREVQFIGCKLAGCFLVKLHALHDERGHLVKTIQSSVFKEHGLEEGFRECFYSTSFANVLRGLHFQLPPSDHAKLVYCLTGAIFDVALDLRVGSPTYGQHEVHELSAGAGNAVYLARGIAHGFYVREAPALTVYHATSEYDPARDAGIRWDSIDAAWPTDAPIVSERDRSFISLAEFQSPFRYPLE